MEFEANLGNKETNNNQQTNEKIMGKTIDE